MKRRKTRKVRRVRRKRRLRRNAPRLNMYTPGEKYIGTFEIAKPDGDYDVWEVVRRGRVFVIGTATNSGLLSDYYFKMEQGESEQRALEEINADLEVLATDGPSYMSRVKKIPSRKIEVSRQRAERRRNLQGNRRRGLRKNSSPYSRTIIKMLNAPIVGYSKGKISPNRYQAALVRFGDGKLGIMIGWWNRMGEFVKTPGSWSLESLKDVGDAIAIDYGQEWAVKGMRGAVEEAQSEVRGLSANPFRVGGYLRETPEEAGYRVVQLKGKELILQDKSNGRLELYIKSPRFAGAAIYYKGNTYEFVSSR